MIEFNEYDHEYFVEGKSYPSVTTILKDVGLIDTSWFTEGSAQRGTYIHEVLALIDNNTPLMMLDIPADIEGYVDAYLRFKNDVDFKIHTIEKHCVNKELQFAGTPDRTGILNDFKAIIDIKTGVKQKWHGAQLSGYKALINGEHRLRGLYLHKDGKYRLESYKDSEYRNIFMCTLSIYHWKNR